MGLMSHARYAKTTGDESRAHVIISVASIKDLEPKYWYSSLDGLLVHRRVIPSSISPVHIYTNEKIKGRQSRANFRVKEISKRPYARLENRKKSFDI